MAELEGGQERRRHARAELHVDLLYDTYSSFLEAAGGNISRSGMFLAVAEPAPVGSVVSFEARLQDGTSLIRGQGEVVRVRDRPEGPTRPKGMAIRFLRLTSAGKELVDGLVDLHRREGSTLRLSGVRVEAATEGGTGPPAQPALPWSQDGPAPVPPFPPAAGAQVAVAPDSAGAPDGTRRTTAGGVRLTERPGAEFEFSLPPDQEEVAPRARLAPEPWRLILLVLASALAVVVVLLVGPRRLLDLASQVGGAAVGSLRGERSAAPHPTSAEAADPGDPDPQPAVAGGEVRVTRATVSREPGGVRITLQLDRTLEPAAVSHSRLADPPRHVVRLVGVGGYGGRPVLEVDGGEPSRVRVGLHPDLDPPELHVVLDLRSARTSVEVGGLGTSAVEIVVRFPGAG